ncbi:MAG: DUF932 domain-containing protein [bacterium]|nr:DUF932 domain-containing protein [bacterium]
MARSVYFTALDGIQYFKEIKIMQTAMKLENLLETVIHQTRTKEDLLVPTGQVEVIQDSGSPILTVGAGALELSRSFDITETAHAQIAARLKIPVKYYHRLMADHPDLLWAQVNELFKREPESRMLRTLDGKLRAFLSNSYRRLDNDIVLEHALPSIVQGDLETKLLSSNVTDKKMYMKVLFPDDRLAQEIGKTADGTPDIVRPGFILRNSEIGQGSLSIDGFFYRSFCENGCHFGGINTMNFKRSHLGGRLIEGVDYSIMSDETRAAEDKALVSQTADVMRALASPELAQKMGDKLRATKDTTLVVNPVDAIEVLAKDVGLRQDEKDSVLESFIKDRDYSLWGAVNAVTEQANNSETCSYDRATELEEIGGKMLSMGGRQWDKIALAEAA